MVPNYMLLLKMNHDEILDNQLKLDKLGPYSILVFNLLVYHGFTNKYFLHDLTHDNDLKKTICVEFEPILIRFLWANK